METSTGYGPSRYSRLYFNGESEKYDIWEEKFLGYLKIKKIKEVVTSKDTLTTEQKSKNEEAYAELIQLIDDNSLALIRKDAKDDGRKALAILREHYAGKGKPRVISLYTELTSLSKSTDQSATEYLIKAENIASSLSVAGETISDSLIIAMILKGLPQSYNAFVAVVTQSEETYNDFTRFKIALKNYEDTLEFGNSSSDKVFKMNKQPKAVKQSEKVNCYSCGATGHKANNCINKREGKLWCGVCQSKTHAEKMCRRKESNTQNASKLCKGSEDDWFCFTVNDSVNKIAKANSMLVDSGATCHITNSEQNFMKFNDSFNPEKHAIELADGTKQSIAQKQGTLKVSLKDSEGIDREGVLDNTLYIPSFPQEIFSIKAATRKGSTVTFGPQSSQLITKNGTKFDIREENNLYYLDKLNSVKSNVRKCDLNTWHRIFGHCNYRDINNVQKVVAGMKIEGTSKNDCETCILGKTVKDFNRNPDQRSTTAMEFVHADLCGPITPIARGGYRYVLGFIDDYSSAAFAYLLKTKDDAARALEKFLADSAPFGTIKRMRTDNGGEFIGKDYEQVLVKNKIKHEDTCPHSPHQNGTIERGWRTYFDMARCLLIESKLPKYLWCYAIMAAVYIRNRCFSQRTKQTPVFLLTKKTPNVKHMHVFGSVCYAYVEKKKKLDNRAEKGIFVGYDQNSPSYLVYFPQTGKILSYRCVRFTEQYDFDVKAVEADQDDDEFSYVPRSPIASPGPTNEIVELMGEDNDVEANAEVPIDLSGEDEDVGENNGSSEETRRYPQRERKPPSKFDDFVIEDHANYVDFCYNVKIPESYEEAVHSEQSDNWKEAMDQEMTALKQNNAFSIVELPKGKTIVGGKWVFNIKAGAGDSIRYKARWVAKGFSQQYGVDYEETFSPTCKISSVRLLLQLAVNYDLIIHQMDVKTAYLNAPIDKEIYMSQPEGYNVDIQNTRTAVCKLNKSLYGLKQSGRNWNLLLHNFFVENKFVQSKNDPCIYIYRCDADLAYLLIWVDDIIIAATSISVMNNLKDLLKKRFHMVDLGPIKSFLGIEFDQKEGVITMSQAKYILSKLKKYGLDNAKPRSTPCELSGYDKMDNSKEEMKWNFRELVGSLIYAMTCTRPDLSWVVTKLSQHLANPSKADMIMINHVFRYLRGTLDHKLIFRKSDLNLIGYVDADWASSQEDRKSTSAYCFVMNSTGPAVSWKTKRQPTVALSSCEAEYMALCLGMQEALYLKRLLEELCYSALGAITVFCDNQGAISLSKNPTHHNRSKHIDIRYHFCRECVMSGQLKVDYVPTNENTADALTKPLGKPKLIKFGKTLFGI